MTREDAIVILKDIQDSLEETRFLKRCAIDMAIEALQENESLARTVIEASELLHKKRSHEEWTKESAIDYLTEIGWLPEHDRILTETRPHGEWIFKVVFPTGYWECSICKKGRLTVRENFCPNCGADMRKEGE